MNTKPNRHALTRENDRIAILEAQLRRVKHEDREARRAAPKVETAETLQRALRLDGVRDRMLVQPMEIRLRAYKRPKAIRELALRLFSQWPAPEFLFKGLVAPEFALELLGKTNEGEPPLTEEEANLMRDLWIDFSRGVSPTDRLKGILNKNDIQFLWELPPETSWQAAITYAKARGMGMNRTQADRLALSFMAEPVRTQALRFFDVNRDWWAERMEQGCRLIWRSTSPEWEPTHIPRRQRRVEEDGWSVEAHGRAWSGFLQRPWRRQASRFEWHMIELLSDIELKEEGDRQQHCVGTYANDCLRYGTRILSLRWLVPESLTPGDFEIERVTLEVTRERRIAQAKGSQNAEPSWQAMKQVHAFARDLSLQVDEYL